jgi:hypothetical protein
LKGLRAHPAGGEIQRKSRFIAPKGYGDREKSLAISAVCEANSLLSGSMEDQWNFFTDQRILRALTIEYQWKSCRL